MDDLGVALFPETSIYIYISITYYNRGWDWCPDSWGFHITSNPLYLLEMRYRWDFPSSWVMWNIGTFTKPCFRWSWFTIGKWFINWKTIGKPMGKMEGWASGRLTYCGWLRNPTSPWLKPYKSWDTPPFSIGANFRWPIHRICINFPWDSLNPTKIALKTHEIQLLQRDTKGR